MQRFWNVVLSFIGLPTDATESLIYLKVEAPNLISVETAAKALCPDGYELTSIEALYGSMAEAASGENYVAPMFGATDVVIDADGKRRMTGALAAGTAVGRFIAGMAPKAVWPTCRGCGEQHDPRYYCGEAKPSNATTTDSYGVDAHRGSNSRFTQVLVDAGAPDWLHHYAMFLLNTNPGLRPSDAADLAVKDWQAGVVTAYGDWHTPEYHGDTKPRTAVERTIANARAKGANVSPSKTVSRDERATKGDTPAKPSDAATDADTDAQRVAEWKAEVARIANPDTDPTARGYEDGRCDGCNGSGVYRGKGYVENGVFKGFEGTCYRCGGKGFQTVADNRRNYGYDNYFRRYTD